MRTRNTQPHINPIDNFDIIRPERHMMPNGITLNLIRAGNEEVVRMDILIHAGTWQQERSLQALFTNRMLREGTNGMNAVEISERLDFYGAWMELTTSVNCNFLTLYTLNKYAEQTITLVSSLLREPTFPEKEFQISIAANKQQFIVNSQKVDVIARKIFNQAYFGKVHPCGRFATEEDYDLLTIEHLHSFYYKHYHSGNCSIYLSGKVNDSLVKVIECELGTHVWGRMGEKTPFLPIKPSPFRGQSLFVDHPNAIQSALRIGNPLVDRIHPDFHKLRVLVTLLGGYFGSRLMRNIREDKGYTYGIGAGIASYPAEGILVINTETANEYVNPCIQEIKKEMKRLQDEMVDERELTMVKNYMLGEICRGYEGPFSLSEAWIYIESAGLSEDFYESSIDTIRKVTPNEIHQMACKYLQPENCLEIIVGEKA